jgi:hypothetical protein
MTGGRPLSVAFLPVVGRSGKGEKRSLARRRFRLNSTSQLLPLSPQAFQFLRRIRQGQAWKTYERAI